jgi:Tol biopolymer transport system component
MKTTTLILLMASALAAQEAHFTATKQLTFGGANAEAYYSPDGSKIVFQATREGYKCDQMYVMNSDGSDQHMISNGKGRTTCGFFLPDGKSIMYASTHEAGPECPPDPDRSKGYLWGVYASYDIYIADLSGKITGKFLPSPGYDAEATINWKTKKVIFTSVRDGDLNLWSADLDGSHLTELTKKLGYDGGAVFSPDGKNILWRAHYPTAPDDVKDYKDKLAQELVAPMKMELMIADADGKNAKQITDYGCASFAPAFSPDGKKIIFSSNKNKCDSRYFDLFLINPDGTGLEQVTSAGDFNSFPMFSPDGKHLVFISNRDAKARYEFNIFVADWKN